MRLRMSSARGRFNLLSLEEQLLVRFEVDDRVPLNLTYTGSRWDGNPLDSAPPVEYVETAIWLLNEWLDEHLGMSSDYALATSLRDYLRDNYDDLTLDCLRHERVQVLRDIKRLQEQAEVLAKQEQELSRRREGEERA